MNYNKLNVNVFGIRRLALADFDGTIARTQEPSPNGMTVDRASRLAVQETLPEFTKQYDEQGGLNNRAPIEVIRDLLPDATPAEHEEFCGQYIAAKLGYTRTEIGARFSNGDVWPRLIPGYRDFHKKVQRFPYTDHMLFSSSHEYDVRLIYEAWGLEWPLIFATEAMSAQAIKHEVALPVKPSPLLVDFALEEWREVGDIDATIPDRLLRENTVAIGDDLMKDGTGAVLSRIAFVLVQGNEKQQEEAWDYYAWRLTHQGALA